MQHGKHAHTWSEPRVVVTRIEVDNLLVAIERRTIGNGQDRRFEITLRASGSAAIVDIPACGAEELAMRTREAVAAFLACLSEL